MKLIEKFFCPMKYYEYTCHKVQEFNIFKVDAQTISSSRLLISHRHSKPFQVLHQRSLNETFADRSILFSKVLNHYEKACNAKL